MIERALYGLTISADRFRSMLADFIHTLDFVPFCYDRDFWRKLRDDKSGYDYICTHVDDFKIVAKDPKIWIDRIAAIFLIKEHRPRSYYLGNDYTYHDGQNLWTYGVQTYNKEAVSRVECIYRCLPTESNPMSVIECHPGLDGTLPSGISNHRKF